MLSSPLFLQFPSSMTDEQFFEFCQMNRDLRIERNKFGGISIMPPTGSETGNRNFNLALQLGNWSEKDGSGICFDSSTGFKLSTGAERSPDVSWISLERWNGLSEAEQKGFAPICPDFVIELRSASDNLKPLQEKMEEYMQEPGIKLGWLIDRKNKRVYVYRPQSVECLENPDPVNGEDVLPGFVLNMSKVW
ncbi:MAG: Uma2 family endonuclease [Cyanobacteriota bacterium]|nr:Uma2 family endonuclease [Cyanobacteriota bacterium]